MSNAVINKTGLILASASPRRLELLQQLGIEPLVIVTDLDETQLAAEHWQDFVSRIALEKARAGFALSPGKLPVLGADTSVIVDDRVLGKPDCTESAIHMLHLISGRCHQVATAIALVLPDGTSLQAINISRVCFSVVPDDFIHSYANSAEPMDKAGAYAVQGQPAAFIERLEGSYSGVMGLPLHETAALLRQAGVAWYDASESE